MTPRRSWWRQPALHFAALGVAVFLVDAWRHPRSSRDVEVSASYVAGVREDLAKRRGSEPSRDEVRAEVDRFVREEVLYREALALGLDRGDLIVRRRLVQKMEFLLEDVAPPHEPSDDELRRYVEAHAERYAAPARITARHVFFDRARRGEHLSTDAKAALEALRGGASPDPLGDPFMSGPLLGDVELARVTRELGAGFARAVEATELGAWQGPVESPYGLHLVRVSARAPGAPPALQGIRAQVAADFRTDERVRSNKKAFEELARGYRVRVEGL